jgi:hypothetical protein
MKAALKTVKGDFEIRDSKMPEMKNDDWVCN